MTTALLLAVALCQLEPHWKFTKASSKEAALLERNLPRATWKKIDSLPAEHQAKREICDMYRDQAIKNMQKKIDVEILDKKEYWQEKTVNKKTKARIYYFKTIYRVKFPHKSRKYNVVMYYAVCFDCFEDSVKVAFNVIARGLLPGLRRIGEKNSELDTTGWHFIE